MRRSSIVPRCFIIVLTLTAVWLSTSQIEARRPNVIVILTDDQGSVDLNAYGATDLQTPHLDALARRGLRFTQFYAAAPVCSPSRAALLTGRTPQSAGVPGNVSSQPNGPGGMPAEQITIAEMLRPAGYATAHVGKWHLGYRPEVMPNAQGFDHSFGHMGGCIDNFSHFFYWHGPNRHDLWRNGQEVFAPGQFFGDLLVDEARQFMAAHRNQPFFLYFALNMPHYPYQGDVRWLQHYQDLPYPRNLYAAFLSTIDDRIGQLMHDLESLQLREHTIVIFQSDHGHSVEERAHGGGGSSGPYRGHKFQLLEGGIRVPAIISWPGTLPEGQVRTQMATACDWLPTIATLCQVPLPDRPLAGKDLSDVLQSETAASPHELFFWESGKQHAVRQGPWKLLGQGEKLQLFRIDHDPGEQNDLASQHPERVAEMQQHYERWLAERDRP